MRVKLDEGAFLPERAHSTDGGLDLRAREDKVVPAGGSAIFDTGVHIELEMVCIAVPVSGGRFVTQCDGSVSYEPVSEVIRSDFKTVGLLNSKSGLKFNHNLTSDGVIDMGYTGSISVKLYNHGKEDYQVKRGDKISQLVILPILTPELEVVPELDETERGDGGFGSTGR